MLQAENGAAADAELEEQQQQEAKAGPGTSKEGGKGNACTSCTAPENIYLPEHRLTAAPVHVGRCCQFLVRPWSFSSAQISDTALLSEAWSTAVANRRQCLSPNFQHEGLFVLSLSDSAAQDLFVHSVII